MAREVVTACTKLASCKGKREQTDEKTASRQQHNEVLGKRKKGKLWSSPAYVKSACARVPHERRARRLLNALAKGLLTTILEECCCLIFKPPRIRLEGAVLPLASSEPEEAPQQSVPQPQAQPVKQGSALPSS